MAQGNSNTVLVWLVIIVVVLSVVFTWRAMTTESGVAPETQSTSTQALAVPSPTLETSGQVGVNIIPQTEEET